MGVEPILPAGRATITLTITLIIESVNLTKFILCSIGA